MTALVSFRSLLKNSVIYFKATFFMWSNSLSLFPYARCQMYGTDRAEEPHETPEKHTISICSGEPRDIKMISFLKAQKSHEENLDDY